jgi:hypothetical protein
MELAARREILIIANRFPLPPLFYARCRRTVNLPGSRFEIQIDAAYGPTAYRDQD